ncbi:tail assembly chaperone [Klebsiella phage Kpn BU9]|nr:tail assembly chaperone [Klebsiella phage Kpn BU9]
MTADWGTCERYARCYNVDAQFLWSLLIKLRAVGSK